MSNSALFEFNHRFEQLLAQLDQTPWPSLRLKQINQLHALIESSLAQAQRAPFNLELGSMTKIFIAEFSADNGIFRGHDPQDLLSFYNYFYESFEPGQLQQFEYLITESLFRLGDAQQLMQFLDNCSWFSRAEDDQLSSITDLLSFQRAFLGKYATRFPEEIRSYLECQLDGQIHGSSHSQIQGLFVTESGDQQSGVIADLTLENLRIFKKSGTDQLRIATHLVDENDILADQGHVLFHWLRQKYPEKIKGHIRLEYTLSEKSSVLSGSSLGLGMAILAQMAFYSLDNNRAFEPRIYGDVAVTGAFDETGNVLPVNEVTLYYKIESAFFSTIQTLVLPFQHEVLARQVLTDLQVKYPLRDIKLIFLSHIDEFENHRDIFFYQRRKVSRRVGQFFREYADFVSVSIIVFILTLGAGFWFGVVKDPVPVTLEIEDKEIVVQNKYGLTLWRGGSGSNHGIITDVINDDMPEVILGYNKYTSSNLSGYVACYDHRGELQWKFKTGKEVRYGDNSIEDQFNGSVSLIKDLNGDGSKEIVTSGVPGNFPNQICVLDNHGNKLSEYWHAGQLQNPRDLEVFSENDTRELVFCGINNEYRTGVILVLDPFRMEGCSPAENLNYLKSETPPGNEIYYIKFPHTHFFVHPGYDRSEIVSNDSKGGLRVKNSFFVTLPNGSVAETPIFYVFNSSFKLLSVSPGDKYYLTYKEFFRDREPLKYGDANLIQYFADIDYWDGDLWQSTITINRRYINASR
ncbi:hypothetical protein HQ531_14655 [bacterium]|nr:hypothetical protein [bacterium]